MFGYIKPFENELKVKEYSFYRAVYCGLCRAMGKKLGRFSRLTLSYDVLFLALMRYRAENTVPSFETKRCGMKKKPMAKWDSVLEYSSSVAAWLNFYKAEDEKADSVGVKKLAASVLIPFFAKRTKKAGLSDMGEYVGRCMKKTAELEKSGTATADELAEVSGDMLGCIFSYGYEGSTKRVAYEIGRHTGRWVYLADALDDYRDDIKKKRFTPFDTCPDTEIMRIALNEEIRNLDASVNLLECEDGEIKAVTDNIVTYGLLHKTDEIITKLNSTEGK